jgi:sensor histidine kinase YesM
MEFRLDRKRVITCFALTAVFNSVIALFLTLLGFGGGFAGNFGFSQAIGLCMCASILGGHLLLRRPTVLGHLVMLLVSMPLGAAAGALIGSMVAGIPLSETLGGRPLFFIQMLFIGIVFGTMITYFFFSREKISQTEALLREEQIKRLTLEKKTLDTHLRLLQAQIEPHFLFNSLSNVLSLLDSDPPRGKAMLSDLTRYLRASLSRTRERTTTLGQELDLVRAFLDIHKVRMGDRLRYTMDLPPDLREISFPPMLVQPIVENAVKHGLEPRVEGGDISIRVEECPGRLRLTVADTGSGLSEHGKFGVGLDNVRERLEALYGGNGRMILEENRPVGLKVTLEVPCGGG